MHRLGNRRQAHQIYSGRPFHPGQGKTCLQKPSKGWKCDISSVRSYEDLPQEAQTYLNRLSEVVGVEIGIVSVGPNRDQTFTLKSFFED